jgi:hypothetical protein
VFSTPLQKISGSLQIWPARDRGDAKAPANWN